MQSEPEKRVIFDPTINLGHLLTFMGFIVTLGIGWMALDKRVVVLEAVRVHQSQVDSRQDYEMAESKRIVRDDLMNISGKLDRLIERKH